MLEFIQKIDMAVIDFIYNNLQHEFIIKGMSFITHIGNYGMIWMLFICILFMSKRHRKTACAAALAFLLSRLIGVHMLKPLIQRPRPFLELQYIEISIPKPISYSFPSGHTISSFSTMWVLLAMLESQLIKFPLVLLAVLISISRVYLMVHYPTDVLAGMALGIICAYIALFIFKDSIPHKY